MKNNIQYRFLQPILLSQWCKSVVQVFECHSKNYVYINAACSIKTKNWVICSKVFSTFVQEQSKEHFALALSSIKLVGSQSTNHFQGSFAFCDTTAKYIHVYVNLCIYICSRMRAEAHHHDLSQLWPYFSVIQSLKKRKTNFQIPQ